MPIRFSDDPGADELVNCEPLALLIAMLLDQQVPLTWAFNGPNRLVERLGRPLDAAAIADLDPDQFAALAGTPPAIHRYHRSMAGRIQAMCRYLVEHYDGRADDIWRDTDDASLVAERLGALPGFGAEKVKITLAVLVKRFDRELLGWEALAAPFSDDQPRSVADVGSAEDFARVKVWKKAQKAAGRDKADKPVPKKTARRR